MSELGKIITWSLLLIASIGVFIYMILSTRPYKKKRTVELSGVSCVWKYPRWRSYEEMELWCGKDIIATVRGIRRPVDHPWEARIRPPDSLNKPYYEDRNFSTLNEAIKYVESEIVNLIKEAEPLKDSQATRISNMQKAILRFMKDGLSEEER